MTRLGKLLVFLNTFFAVILFGWAVSLYTNRVDWFDRTFEDGSKVDGRIPLLQAEVKRYSEQIKATQQAYASGVERLQGYQGVEIDRDFRNKVLANRMSDVKRIDDKVRFLVQVRQPRSALIDVRAAGESVKSLGGTDLKGLASLNKRFDELSRETLARQASINKLRKDYEALSNEVLVVQAEVLRQKVIFNNTQDEQDYLSDARINWEERLRTLEIRKSQLQTRLETLGVPAKLSRN